MNEKLRIAVCIPIHVSASIHVSFLINFINRLGELDPKKYNPTILFTTKTPIDRARNFLIEEALKKDITHLWFIDCDQVIPKGTLEELLSMDSDIASGLYFEKGKPYWPCIREWRPKGGIHWFRNDNIKWNSVMEVDGVGMGCILIKAHVFEKIKKPWFKYERAESGEGEILMGEDLYFCKKARDAGFKILVNTKFVVGHIGGLITEREFAAYQDLRENAKKKELENNNINNKEEI